jgi:hypothetical protein
MNINMIYNIPIDPRRVLGTKDFPNIPWWKKVLAFLPWNRLATVEDVLADILAEEIRKEIDAEILKEILGK